MQPLTVSAFTYVRNRENHESPALGRLFKLEATKMQHDEVCNKLFGFSSSLAPLAFHVSNSSSFARLRTKPSTKSAAVARARVFRLAKRVLQFLLFTERLNRMAREGLKQNHAKNQKANLNSYRQKHATHSVYMKRKNAGKIEFRR